MMILKNPSSLQQDRQKECPEEDQKTMELKMKLKNPWSHPQDRQEECLEEDQKTTELYRKFQGILSKLTPQKFQSLTEQALILEINTEERLMGVIDMIFTKVRVSV